MRRSIKARIYDTKEAIIYDIDINLSWIGKVLSNGSPTEGLFVYIINMRSFWVMLFFNVV